MGAVWELSGSCLGAVGERSGSYWELSGSCLGTVWSCLGAVWKLGRLDLVDIGLRGAIRPEEFHWLKHLRLKKPEEALDLSSPSLGNVLKSSRGSDIGCQLPWSPFIPPTSFTNDKPTGCMSASSASCCFIFFFIFVFGVSCTV